MILRLNDTKLSVIDGSMNGTGSSNIPIKLQNDSKFNGYATTINVMYINKNREQIIAEIAYNITKKEFVLPSSVFKYSTNIVIGVMNQKNNEIYNSEPLVLFVPKTPYNGDVLSDVSTMTWQDYVRTYVNSIVVGGINNYETASTMEAINYLGDFINTDTEKDLRNYYTKGEVDDIISSLKVFQNGLLVQNGIYVQSGGIVSNNPITYNGDNGNTSVSLTSLDDDCGLAYDTLGQWIISIKKDGTETTIPNKLLVRGIESTLPIIAKNTYIRHEGNSKISITSNSNGNGGLYQGDIDSWIIYMNKDDESKEVHIPHRIVSSGLKSTGANCIENFLITKTFVEDNITINHGSYTLLTIPIENNDATVGKFKPISVDGFIIDSASQNGTMSTWCSPYRCIINGQEVSIGIRNHNDTTDAKVKVSIRILYYRSNEE